MKTIEKQTTKRRTKFGWCAASAQSRHEAVYSGSLGLRPCLKPLLDLRPLIVCDAS